MHIHTTNGIGVSVLNGLTNCSALGVTLLNKNDSLLHLVRVPYGPVKVRITAEYEARVELHFEDQKRLETKIPAGTHLLELGDDGQPILFAAPEENEIYSRPGASDADEDPLDPREHPRYADYIEAALTAINSGNHNEVATPAAPAEATAASGDELSFSAVTAASSGQTEIPGFTVEEIGFDDIDNGDGDSEEITGEALEKATKTKRRPHHSGFLGVVVQYVEQPPVPGVMPPSYAEAVVAFQLNPPEKHYRAVAKSFHRIVPPEPTTKRWCSCCNH